MTGGTSPSKIHAFVRPMSKHYVMNWVDFCQKSGCEKGNVQASKHVAEPVLGFIAFLLLSNHWALRGFITRASRSRCAVNGRRGTLMQATKDA